MNSPLPPPPRSYCRSHKLIGPGMHKLGISCRHFSDLTLQSMDRPLTLGEKFRFKFHYLACSVCRRFEKQMRSFTALIQSSFSEQEPKKPNPEYLTSVRATLERLSEGKNR